MPSMRRQSSKNPLKRRVSVLSIIFWYSSFTLFWILVSDYLLDNTGLPNDMMFVFGVAKGLLYMVLSALLLFVLISRLQDRQLEQAAVHQSPSRHGWIFAMLLLMLVVSPLLSQLVRTLYGDHARQQAISAMNRSLTQKTQFLHYWLQERNYDVALLQADQALQQKLIAYQADRDPTHLSALTPKLERLLAPHAFSRVELYLEKSLLVLGSSQKLMNWPAVGEYPVFACDDVTLLFNCRLGWQIMLPTATEQSAFLRLEVALAQFVLPELSTQFDPSLTIVAAVTPEQPQPLDGQLLQYMPIQLGQLHVQTTASLEQVLKPVNTLVSWLSLISMVVFSMLAIGALLYWRQLILAHQLSLKGREQEKSQLQTAFFSSPFVGMAIVSRPDLRLIELNTRLQQMLLEDESLQQKPLQQIVAVQDWPILQQTLAQLPAENAQMSCPLLLNRAGQPPLQVQLSVYALKPEQRGESVLLLSLEDVSERLHFKSNLSRRAQLMATMATLSQQLLQDSDWLGVLRTNLPSLAKHLQADNIFLYQCHHHADGADAWRLANWRAQVLNVHHDFVHLTAALLKEFELDSRLSRGEVVAGPLSAFSAKTQQMLGVNGTQALAVFPVMIDQFWWGFIGLSSEQTNWCWNQSELDTLKLLADNFGNAIKRQQFETSLQQAAVVFENTREGIMVTDHENRIIQVNQSLLDMLGYEEDEVLGQNPNMFSSGRHHPTFYRELWQQLQVQGHWQGEIWNRRKNGEIYPELLSINSIFAPDGSIKNYVAVFADITQLKASQQELEFLAHHDVLTGLPNRLMMLSRLDGVIDTASRQNQSFALMMLDLDRFKYVNDSFGHPAGDELLKLVAERLLLRLRKVDTLARFGGDEFMVLLPVLEHEEDAGRLASEIIEQLNQPWILSNNAEVRIGVSIGIALYPQHGTSGATLLQNADAALYRAKEQGRSRFAYYSDDLTQYARTRIDIESRLRHALAAHQFIVYYQPQIDIKSGLIIGAEALIRWQDPVAGLISPAIFIPIAEDTGLIGAIGHWVLQETCRQGSAWLSQGFSPVKLAVNLSSHQFSHGDITQTVRDVLAHSGFPPHLLELELTESAIMAHEDVARRTLIEFNQMDIQLAIDDFGTGYSSFAYLKKYQLDVLKIDKSFVDDVPLDPDSNEIVSAIISMAKVLKLKTLAEGVETAAQLEFLQASGCDYFQGYYFSKPVPAEQFAQLLLRQQQAAKIE